MARQEVVIEFDDDLEESDFNVEPSSAQTMNDDFTFDVELDNDDDNKGKPDSKDKKKDEESILEVTDDGVEIIDDTPPEDRGRKKSEPPKELTDAELSTYSQDVQRQIRHYRKVYHDERRAKEAALRERDESVNFSKRLYNDNVKFRQTNSRANHVMLENAKKAVGGEVEIARGELEAAHSAGDTAAIVKAQERLNEAQIKMQRLNEIKIPPLQKQNPGVQDQQQRQQPQQRRQEPPRQPEPDERALRWRDENDWWGVDDPMTEFAKGVHKEIAKEGKIQIGSDEYYDELTNRVRGTFPDYFGSGETASQPGADKTPKTVVGGASRSASPTKLRLTKSQLKFCKTLGITPKQYAEEQLKLAKAGRS